QATNGDLIFITSNAGSVATVAPGALLFNSTIKIRKGDLYVFAFLGAFEKWGLWHSPTRTPKLTSELAQPIAPRTRFTIRPANWLSQVRLPQQAGDRDRIIITSTAQRSTRILPANIINPAAMTVSSGEEYEFLYVKEKNDGLWRDLRIRGMRSRIFSAAMFLLSLNREPSSACPKASGTATSRSQNRSPRDRVSSSRTPLCGKLKFVSAA